MSSPQSILEIIVKLRERINRYGEMLRKNEALTRYVLIDPLLRALGWDTEDPEKVRPEERQGEGVPDYVLYMDGERVIAIEAKSLGTNLDEKKILDLGFRYGWQNRIPYFVITDGDRWDVYDLGKPGGEKIISVSISKEDPGEVVAKLLSLWYPLVARKKVEPVKPLTKGVKAEQPVVVETRKPELRELDLEKVREFYSSLTDRERTLIEVVFKAWREKRTLSKNEIIEEMKKRDIVLDRRGFTGVKSGITRLAEKLGLPAPLPTQKELGDEYRDERKRYQLKDEWGRALEKILVIE